MTFVIMKSNVHEMTPFVYLAKGLNVDAVRFYRMHEYDGWNWQCTDKNGASFDYKAECAPNFVEEFNRQVRQAELAANLLGIRAELPGPVEMVSA